MMISRALLSALVLVVALVATSWAQYHIPSNTKVVELSHADMVNRSHPLYKGFDWWLVKYYKPDCGASLNLLPQWENLAKDQVDDQDFVVARFNCVADDKARELCSKQGRNFYPDITLFRKGRNVGRLPFETNADVPEIVKWALPLKKSIEKIYADLDKKTKKEL